MQIFESSGTFSLKAGTAYKVICVGGGQSGRAQTVKPGVSGTSDSAPGNAGYVKPGAFVADSDAVVPVTVGAGGVPVYYSNDAVSGYRQANGEASSFGQYVTAPGGSFDMTTTSGIRSDGIQGAAGFRFWEPKGTPYELLSGTGYGAGGGRASGAGSIIINGSGLPGCVIVMW
jgi:hypothetical protein